jgi:DNA-binding NtrC family response regulator
MSEPRIRVLCIDDEARILRALKALFRDMEVYTTTDPAEAIRWAAEKDIDVLVCDQRMPKMQGIEVLREVRIRHPRAMRLLLTGYADLNAVIGSVNEGEVFRYINKPWDNTELRAVVQLAARIARETPPVQEKAIDEIDKEQARKQVGILVIEDDPEVQQRLREILAPHYQVRFVSTPDRALSVLEQNEVGVVISETAGQHGDFTALLKALKQYHPHIATVVVTDRANAQVAIDLINEGQVFRLLLKPLRMGSCRLSVDAAVGRYWYLKQNPQAARRYVVAAKPESQLPAWLSGSLLQRIRMLPQRLLGLARAG